MIRICLPKRVTEYYLKIIIARIFFRACHRTLQNLFELQLWWVFEILPSPPADFVISRPYLLLIWYDKIFYIAWYPADIQIRRLHSQNISSMKYPWEFFFSWILSDIFENGFLTSRPVMESVMKLTYKSYNGYLVRKPYYVYLHVVRPRILVPPSFSHGCQKIETCLLH